MHSLSLLAAILVTLNGEPVNDAQICGFKASAADTPFHQLLASDEIVCNTPFSPGLWNVLARRGSDLVSARTVLVDTRQELPDVELRLESAATVTFTNVPAKSHGVVYLTDTLSAFPAAGGTALVPADRDLVPLLGRDGAPVAIGDSIRLDAHGKKSVALDPASRGIATWVAIAPADLEALRTVRRKQPPQINGVINPIRGTMNLNHAMQFIRGVPAGAATIELSGAPWKRQTASVVVPATGVAITPSPLMLIPTSSATVRWSSRRKLLDLAGDRNPPCRGMKEEKAHEARPVVSLLSCKGHQSAATLDYLDRDSCRAIGEREWSRDQQNGDVTFEDIEAGAYVVEFAFGDLPPIRSAIRLDRFEQTAVPLDIDYSTLFGRVTVGGAKVPGPVSINFRFQRLVYTDDDGNYSVVLQKPLTAEKVVSVRSCDGSVDGETIVDHDVLPNSRFDIDLSTNRLTVEAKNADSGAPVPGAIIRYGAFRTEEMSSTYYFKLAAGSDDAGNRVLLRTDRDGRYVIGNLPPDRTVRVCLEHEDYERSCADPLKLTSTEEQTLRITMKPKGLTGRIAGVPNIAGGQLYWFATDGRETERADVKSDGAFRYTKSHDPSEVVSLVSLNLPLFVFAQPQIAAGESMIVNVPPASPRSFSVSIGEDNPQQDAVVTIAIGNLVVPYPAFAQHLALHGSQLALQNRGPLLVPDILETAPISVILGPPLAEMTPAMRMIDLFRLPQYRGLPRRAVGADGRVVFSVLGRRSHVAAISVTTDHPA